MGPRLSRPDSSKTKETRERSKSSPVLLKTLDEILTITVFIQVFTILHSFFVGILRECDLVNTITYLIVGCITLLMPVICYILVFKLNLDVPGLFRGMLISYILTSIILFGLYLTLDYEKICEKYVKKIERKNDESDEHSKPLKSERGSCRTERRR